MVELDFDIRNLEDEFSDYFTPKNITFKLIGLLIFFGFVYVARPIYHGIIYKMVYTIGGVISIPFVLAIILGIIFAPKVSDNLAVSLTVKSLALFFIPPIVASTLSFIYLYRVILGFSIIAILILGLTYLDKYIGLGDLSDADFRLVKFGIIASLLVFSVSGFIVYSGLVENREVAIEAMDEAELQDVPPQYNAENPRIIPRMVDEKQATGSVSYRQWKLGVNDIARAEDGSMVWTYPIVPDGTRNVIFENQRGLFKSDLTSFDNRSREPFARQPQDEFNPGRGMVFHKSADWNLKKNEYFSKYNDDPTEFMHDGEAYMSYPEIGHKWEVSMEFGFIPVPYTKPTWNGVSLVDTDGNIESLTPEEAQESDILEGQRLYPLPLTEYYMERLGYRNGIVNQMSIIGSHQDEIEIASMPSGAGNSQPFIVDTEEKRFSYVTAFEPYGEDTTGLDEVWFVDSRTGEMKFTTTESGEDVFGPQRALGLVESEDRRTDWERFDVVEPVPVYINDTLYWHTKVIPNDNLAVSANVFVNTESGEAFAMERTETVKGFIDGELTESDVTLINEGGTIDDSDDNDRPDNNSPTTNGTVTIRIIEDGEIIDTIEVGGNRSVEIGN